MKKNYLFLKLAAVLMLLNTALFAQYCVPYSDESGFGVGIGRVSIKDATQISMQFEGYNDYTGTSFFSTYSGQQLNFEVLVGLNTRHNVLVWVDWDQNESFDWNEDITEINDVYPGQIAKGYIFVPNGTIPGTYRVRFLAADRNAFNTTCSTEKGEFEDYEFTVLPDVNMFVSGSTLTHPLKPGNFISKTVPNQNVLNFNIKTDGNQPFYYLNAIYLNNNGSTNSSAVSTYKLYYSGTSTNFNTATLISQSNQIQNLTIDPLSFAYGPDHYFWLSVDLDPNANLGDTLDFGVDSLVFDNGDVYRLSQPSPAGIYVINDNPIVPGNGNWNVYGINSNDLNIANLKGFYNDESDLNFDSRNSWDDYLSPSSANNYSGLNVNDENHSVIASRKGFPHGLYNIDITGHDDDAFLEVNGNQVWSHYGCCDSHWGVWQGPLDSNSVINLKWKDFGGGSYGAINISQIYPNIYYVSNYTPLSGDTIEIYGENFYGVTTVLIGGDTVQFTVVNSELITAVVACGTANNLVEVITEYGNTTNSGIVMYSTFYQDFDGDGYGNPLESLTQCTLPAGYVVNNLDCDDENASVVPPTWYYDGDNDGYGVTYDTLLNCNQPTGYVSISGDCDDSDSTISPATSCNFPVGVWHAYGFQNNDFTHYLGYYVDTNLNINSANYYDPAMSPSLASNYVGDPIPTDYHSVSYARKGFPSGMYQINIPGHEYGAFLSINGNDEWYHYWGCCDSHTNVWSGHLDSTSTVEFYWFDDGDGSYGQLEFVAPAPIIDWTSESIAQEGDVVDIEGYNFFDVDSVTVGGVKVDTFTVSDQWNMQITLGCHPSGDIIIYTPYGQSNGVLLNSVNGAAYFYDEDGDGFGTPTNSFVSCNGSLPGYVTVGGDCNDQDPAINPGVVWYIDKDNDGYGADVDTFFAVNNVTATSYYNSDNLPEFAFDGDTVDYGWGNDGDYVPDALTFELVDGPKAINTYSFFMHPDQIGGWDYDGYSPRDWTFEGFNGTSWDVLDNRKSVDMSQNQWYKFSFVNNTPYQKYKLNVTYTYDESYVRITEMKVGIGSVKSCEAVAGFTTKNGDCNDNDSNIIPTVWYADNDGDTYYNAADSVYSCTQPSNYIALATALGADCDDAIDTIYQTATFYIDADGDGYTNGTSLVCYGASIPTGYANNSLGNDCDDNDAAVFISELVYVDADGDGYHAGQQTICYDGSNIPTGFSSTTSGPDCDDSDLNANIGGLSFFLDNDGDGYGNAADSVYACSQPIGYVTNNTDCDDNNDTVYQSNTFYIDADNDGYTVGEATICFGANIPAGYSVTSLGNDCNDADDQVTFATNYFYADADGDMYVTADSVLACSAPTGYITLSSALGSDCDDNDDQVTIPTNYFYADADGDMYVAADSVMACSAPTGYISLSSALGSDCDDNDDQVTVATEYFYADADGDMYVVADSVLACSAPSGYISLASALGSDCDDNNDQVIGATTYFYADADGDMYVTADSVLACSAPSGYISLAIALGSDCDDNDANVHYGTADATITVDNSMDPMVMLDGPAGNVTYTWYVEGVEVGNAVSFDSTFTTDGTYEVVLVASGNCGAIDSDTVSVTISNTSVKAFVANTNVVVAPNPANAFVNVTAAGVKLANVQLVNVNGQVISETKVDFSVVSTTNINTSSMANGVYFVKVISENTSTITRLIINR